LDLSGNVVVNGTIVHEGHAGIYGGGETDPANPYGRGHLKVIDGSNVTIDGFAGEFRFYGAAIVGQPLLVVEGANTVLNVKGIAQVGGELGFGDENPSILGGRTTIDGVLMDMCDSAFSEVPRDVFGPGTSLPVEFYYPSDSFHNFVLRNSAAILYKKPPVVPQGFFVGGGTNGFDGVRRPTVISWQQI
jgi:hypothetical protein